MLGHKRFSSKSSLYDGDNVVLDRLWSGSAWSDKRQYVTPFLDQNLSMTEVGTGDDYYYSQDGLGSVRTLTDGAGGVRNRYAYSAFGEGYAPNTNVTVQQRYGYTGREKNALSGLNVMRYRVQNPSIGRFTSRDPAMSPESNLYGYVRSSPARYIDPFGLFDDWDAVWGPQWVEALKEKRAAEARAKEAKRKKAALHKKILDKLKKGKRIPVLRQFEKETKEALGESDEAAQNLKDAMRKENKLRGILHDSKGRGEHWTDYASFRVTEKDCCDDADDAQLSLAIPMGALLFLLKVNLRVNIRVWLERFLSIRLPVTRALLRTSWIVSHPSRLRR